MLRTIGLMSGTSLDGVDAAYVETDGERVGRFGRALTIPYPPALRRDLRALLDAAPALHAAGRLAGDPALLDCARRLTEHHAEAVAALGAPADLIGFHGQTILHRPAARPGERGHTWQIGDPALLARRTGVEVVHDFRSADVAAGGQGAPLVPVFHRVLAEALPKPVALLNLGGVGNVTWIGEGGELVAFDTGPANGPLDDLARRALGQDCDRDGALAAAGRVDAAVLARLSAHPYLAAPPPKSLDRLDFDRAIREAGVPGLAPADAAATLAAFCAACVAAAVRHLPAPPRQWLVAGGGRRNPALMRALEAALAAPLRPAEAEGWDGDALEAQAFGVLAARVARGLPLTFPGTTGAPRPMTGGRRVPAFS
ncbi:anhydro-N-acetylmuramic acid kinase [Roseomonas nepalensis]|uniref:Anhydro-N-acetylmuramic acid kinase n=1 Tax=Muricoccus nepalensis TaxID=1854500 RepID=A0A502G378_9PROT|nr:anhydro-N-acetylmuramic acid kinase [Roseomonas nepalensis]TPG55686.1 anhydro-N-acetylmuramic acid kinase [Roseomonas nepalensis]